jgi:hypothetical protein
MWIEPFDLNLEELADKLNATYITGTGTGNSPVGILKYKEKK